MAELQKVDDWLSALLANLEPAARSRMMRQLAQELRRTQQQNIRMQRNPDGSSYDSASVQFEGKVQRIARVHHYGLRDRVSRKGPEVRYAERRLLGVNDDVEAMTRDMILQWLAG